MVQDLKAGRIPPYISYSSFRTMVGHLKELGVPTQIDSSVLGNFSGTVKTQLLTALRFLGLVEQGGRTGPKLNGLAEAFQTPQWSPALTAVLREAYKPIVALDLKTATPNMVDKAFRDEYGATDQVRQKCITFFLHAAKDAAVGLSVHLTNKTRRPGKRGPRTPRVAAPPAEQEVTSVGQARRAGGAPSASAWTTALLEKFPAFDAAWPDDVKAKWFDGFERLMKAGNPGEES
jgi:hypothetical protein